MTGLAGPRSNVRERPSLKPPEHGDTLVATNIDSDGNAVALWADNASAEALRGHSVSAGGAAFPDIVLDRPVQARLTTQSSSGEVLARTSIRDLWLAHPHIATMPGGQWLVAGSRCRWTSKRVDANAVIYSSTGRALRHGTLGDGIQQLRTTPDGDIWVGYFDEGIFGNFGWGMLGGPEPIGAPGLVRFDSRLHRTWSYPQDPDYPIYDDPEINVDGDQIWATFDADYPVVRISQGGIQAWTNPIGPTAAVLVDSTRIALFGESITIGELRDDAFHPTATATLTPPAGEPAGVLSTYALGPTLHAFAADGAWWTTDIDTLVTISR